MIIDEPQLLKIAECKSRTKLLEWLDENGIKYLFTRRRRVVTTLDQVNKALESEQREDIRIG